MKKFLLLPTLSLLAMTVAPLTTSATIAKYSLVGATGAVTTTGETVDDFKASGTWVLGSTTNVAKGYNGLALGNKGNAYKSTLTLTKSNIPVDAVIKKVTLNANGGAKNNTFTWGVQVDDIVASNKASFTCSSAPASNSNTGAADYPIENINLPGNNVVIDFSNNSGAHSLYIWSISIEFEEAKAGPKEYHPGFETSYTIHKDGEDEMIELNPKEGPAITYTSSNPEVAVVEDGILYGYEIGDATITASWEESEEWLADSTTFEVHVKAAQKETSLTWSVPTFKYNIGEELTAPTLTITPEDAPVVYTSSNTSVATITDGVLKIEGRGTATITAEIEESDLYKGSSASYSLTVIDPNAMDVTFDFINNEYGMTRESGNSSSYNADGKEFSQSPVTVTLGGEKGSRLWADGLRFYKGGTATVSVPSNYVINEITYQAKNDDTNHNIFFITENVISNSIESGNVAIETITVKFAKKPKKQELVLDLSADNYDLTGHTESWLDEAGVTNVIYYVPECDETFTLQTKSVAELAEDAETNWEIYLLSEPENKEALEMIFDGGSCMFTPSEAGVYGVDFYVPATENYDFTAATGVQRIHVYPHADNHFKYEPQDLENCMYEDGMFRLNRHDETNPDKAYTYHFKRVMMAEAEATKMRAPQHEGFEEYDHEAGIDINGVKELQFIAEKNGVQSLNPAVINVSEISTGVATIAAEDGEAVYFDLQGRRLQGAPEQGIYLVRTGNKVEKAVK